MAAILFMTFLGFNDEGSHSLLVFVSVCGGGSHFAPDFCAKWLPPTSNANCKGDLKTTT